MNCTMLAVGASDLGRAENTAFLPKLHEAFIEAGTAQRSLCKPDMLMEAGTSMDAYSNPEEEIIARK